MLPLIPEWTYHYGEFWRAIRTRNLWFIRLRYIAVVMLIGFLLVGEFLLEFILTNAQIIAISLIATSILIYNLTLHKIRKYVGCDPNKFNCLHLSLIQMVLDLISLMVLVYYTGLISSPLYMFFIFHMIIGSLILPGYLVYTAAGVVSFTFILLNMLQRYDLINNHFIQGLHTFPQSHNMTYDIIFLIVFVLMLFISVYIGNKISKQLYTREQQLRTTLEKLNEAEIAKQKYIMGVVHEVKTPVTAIHSIIDIILNKFTGPINNEVEVKLKRAQIRTLETLNLLNDILQISKLKLLDIRNTEEVDINEYVLKLIDKHLETAKAKNIELNYVDKRENKKNIKSDRLLLDLAISNILSNAIKYSNNDGKVELLLANYSDGIVFEINDNGIGIPKEEIKKIFSQFYRASNIDKTRHEGTGMGLAIVKEITEMLGGEISIESPSKLGTEKNPGTCCTIKLPYIYKRNQYDIFEVNNQDYLSSNSNF